MKKKKIMGKLIPCIMSICLVTGCAAYENLQTASQSEDGDTAIAASDDPDETIGSSGDRTGSAGDGDENTGTGSAAATYGYDEKIELDEEDGTVSITKGGTYLITGSSDDCTLMIDAGSEETVTLILKDAKITSSSAAIYVASAGETELVLEGESGLINEDGFEAIGDEEIDAVIYSKDDLTVSGSGNLTIESGFGNGISANDSLVINGGSMTINAADDGINVNEDFLITGGTLKISAGDDGIHADVTLTADGGEMEIEGAEGLEATAVLINDGVISISASDDGINAAQKSEDTEVKVEINGGDITIVMAQGDTDGIDSNGDLIINGGRIDITGPSACDFDGKAELNGGTLIVNGEETDTITGQFMGGGFGRPGFGGTEGTEGGFGRPDFGGAEGTEGGFGRPDFGRAEGTEGGI